MKTTPIDMGNDTKLWETGMYLVVALVVGIIGVVAMTIEMSQAAYHWFVIIFGVIFIGMLVLTIRARHAKKSLTTFIAMLFGLLMVSTHLTHTYIPHQRPREHGNTMAVIIVDSVTVVLSAFALYAVYKAGSSGISPQDYAESGLKALAAMNASSVPP